jgi:hypothetical protein
MVDVPYYYSSSKGEWIRLEDMHKQHLINVLCKFSNETVKYFEEKQFRITLDVVVTDDNLREVKEKLFTCFDRSSKLGEDIYDNLNITEIKE